VRGWTFYAVSKFGRAIRGANKCGAVSEQAFTQRAHSQPQLGGADWPSHSAQSRLWVHELLICAL
jgi:hypothetical protein